MKNMIIATVASVGISTASMAADSAPEQGLYVGGVYNFLKYKEDGFSSISPKALAIQGGWSFNKNMAAEMRVGFNAGSDSMTDTSFGIPIDVEFKVKSYVSGYFRGTLPFNDMFSIYGLAGYTSIDVEAKASSSGFNSSASGSDSGFSFGVGGEVTFAGHSSVALEWARLVSADAYDLDAVSLGYRYRF